MGSPLYNLSTPDVWVRSQLLDRLHDLTTHFGNFQECKTRFSVFTVHIYMCSRDVAKIHLKTSYFLISGTPEHNSILLYKEFDIKSLFRSIELCSGVPEIKKPLVFKGRPACGLEHIYICTWSAFLHDAHCVR